MRKLKNTTKISLICSYSKCPITIPIRHYNLIHLDCIFDIDTIIELKEESSEKNIKCPSCLQIQSFDNFGVDRQLYNVIETIKAFNLNKNGFEDEFISYEPWSRKYYVMKPKSNKK